MSYVSHVFLLSEVSISKIRTSRESIGLIGLLGRLERNGCCCVEGSVHRHESSSNLAAYLFSPAVQFCTMVIGDATALSAAMFSKNRPSGATAYCARARNPVNAMFPPVAS